MGKEIILACRIMQIAAGADPANGAERFEPRFVCEEMQTTPLPSADIFRMPGTARGATPGGKQNGLQD